MALILVIFDYAAEAVRGRIDWKYALGLELTDPGFDYSVLSEFRQRLIASGAECKLLETILDRCQAKGLLGGKKKQRTDSTYPIGLLDQWVQQARCYPDQR